MSFDFSYFDSYEAEFRPEQSGFRDKVSALPDGIYDMEIVDAKFDSHNGTPILRVGLKVNGGSVFEHTYWIDKQEKMNSLGADMAILGFGADQWGKFGLKLRDVLPRLETELPGKKFKALRITDVDKKYPKLRIMNRIGGAAMPATAAPFASAPAPAAVHMVDMANPPF